MSRSTPSCGPTTYRVASSRRARRLIILPITGIQHTIVKGDTLASLATKYKSNVHDIASYNGLADTSSLTVGDSIIIPDGEATGISGSSSSQSSGGSSHVRPSGVLQKAAPPSHTWVVAVRQSPDTLCGQLLAASSRKGCTDGTR